MSYPTKGRVIFFWPPGAPEPLGAFVAGVDPSKTDGCHLHLLMMDPTHGVYLIRGVQGNAEGPGEGQWQWPPRPAAGTTTEGVEKLEAIATRFETLLAKAEELNDEPDLQAVIPNLDEQIRQEIARGDYRGGVPEAVGAGEPLPEGQGPGAPPVGQDAAKPPASCEAESIGWPCVAPFCTCPNG